MQDLEMKDRVFWRKAGRFAAAMLLLLLAAEIFLFNYKSFLLHPLNRSRYEEQFFPPDQVELSGLAPLGDEQYEVTEGNPTLSVSMNQPVKTLFLEAAYSPEEGRGEELTADIAYATESYRRLRGSSRQFRITEAVPSSRYQTCSYFGNVREIRLTLHAEAGTILRLGGFAVNRRIPLHFSPARILFLWLIACGLWLFWRHPAFGEEMDLSCRSHRLAAGTVLGGFLLLVFFTYHLYSGDYHWSRQTGGNQMTQELVDAFAAGQVSLLEEPSRELLELENPYDWSERSDAGIFYLWDHLLFEGKYYSYYGIAPVLTLFLPYTLLTGYYFPSSLACLMYSLTAALFLGLCLLSIIRNWFGETPLRLVLPGLAITLFSSGVFINVYATQFYEIAQSAALCFLTVGFFFLLNSHILTKKKIRLSFLFWSAVFGSLAVLSRATCALYAFAMVCWLACGLLRFREEQGGGRRAEIKYLACALGPYVFFALIQMAYNALRFRNPLDFGIEYTLTIYDYMHIDLHFGIVMVSLVNFLFTVPVLNTVFPFIHGNYDSLQLNGYYFVATQPVFGVIPSVPPLLALLYAPKTAKYFTRREKVRLFFLWFLPGILFPLLLIAMTWQYGYAMRYQADFAWQLCMAALAVIYTVYNRLENEALKKWLTRLFFAASCWCVCCYMAAIFSTNPLHVLAHHREGAELYYRIRGLVSFWS